ncbi:helix-turn-helix domain-containing protein [Mobilicoccus pelagius]|uniref:Putative TetR family transcriptional regulator n=1 Tax=Mobilicoccus pelagius NBRC 104925 TaxID=1089455 RepID=H5UML8_9MICO|nr:helix-turn-helix domain-containing protein [Mobilicoccus pelagius]GAB46976.1 putative TetR family transcriptional regulator [Mobilicoccus pelagius NBRC 104925]
MSSDPGGQGRRRSDILNVVGHREDAERQLLGAAVRQARTARGLSVRRLAEAIDVSAATICAVEQGRTRVDADRLHALAAALEVRPRDLLAGPGLEVGAVARNAPERPPARYSWRHFAELPIDPALAGAISAFVVYGYHGAGIRVIAQHAGLSVTGVYHHYASKELLLISILDLTMSDLVWRLDAAAREARERQLDPLSRFALVVEALALFHACRRDLAFIGASEMRSLPPAERRRIARIRVDVQRRLEAEITTCVHRDLAPAQDVAAAGRAISTMCTSICQWFRPAGPLTPEAVARDYSRYAVGLIGASVASL